MPSWTLAIFFGLLLSLSFCGTGSPSTAETATPCADCHHREGNDQVGEWLGSPYSQAEGGLGCIDCHGPRCSGMRRSGGVQDHRTGIPARLARPAADLMLSAICSADRVEAEIAVSNMAAGHDLPTGPPTRRLLLEVMAYGPDGRPLNPAGDPGDTGLASLSVDSVARVSPGPGSFARFAAFRPRLSAFGTDVSRYHFDSSEGAGATVEARLLIVGDQGAGREIARSLTTCIPSSHVEEVRR